MEHGLDAYDFGEFRLLPRQRILTRSGAPVAIGDRAFDLLALLAERYPDVVSPREIFARVWEGLTVDEGNLRFQVREARRVLGSNHFIAAVRGRGYCLTVPVARTGQVLSEAPPPASGLDLPDLIGRDTEVMRLRDLLARHRLVTLAGPGGIGKTRLATEMVRELASGLARSVWTVDLSAMDDPTRVAGAVALALGIDTSADRDAAAAIRAWGASRRGLMLLDNCEGVIMGVAALLEALLPVCPGLRVLATSQERIGIAAEHVFPLAPLSVPMSGDADAAAHGALRLLERRAFAADGRFRIDAGNVAQAIALCRRLDGLPLAIEMAAARLPLLGLDGLIHGLEDRLRMLRVAPDKAPGRHRSLAAMVDWSYGLLTGEDQRAFRLLGVFPGSFSLDAAASVLGGELADRWTALDLIERLTRRSLLALEPGTPVRYRYFETLRLHAAQQLRASGEQDLAAGRLATYLTGLFDEACERWETMTDAEWLGEYRPELGNLRAALNWAVADRARCEVALALGAGGLRLLHALSLVAEAADYYQRLVACTTAAEPSRIAGVLRYAGLFWNHLPETELLDQLGRAAAIYRTHGAPLELGLVLSALGFLKAGQGETGVADAMLAEASTLLASSDRTKSRVDLHRHLGLQAFYRGDLDTARLHTSRSIDLAYQVGLSRAAAYCNNLAVIEFVAGNIDRAIELTRTAIAGARDGNGLILASALSSLGYWLLAKNDVEAARQPLVEAFTFVRQGEAAAPRFLQAWAVLAAYEGRLREAAKLFGYAAHARALRGEPMVRSEQISYDGAMVHMARLPERERARLTEEGATWDAADAIDFIARQLFDSPSPA